jgi:hypothetical protein
MSEQVLKISVQLKTPNATGTAPTYNSTEAARVTPRATEDSSAMDYGEAHNRAEADKPSDASLNWDQHVHPHISGEEETI